MVCFLLDGKIITIDKKSFQNPSVKASSGASISILDHSQLETENLGVGMYHSLMGIFICPTLVLMIGSILGKASTSLNLVSFGTSHIEDPWILHSPSTSSDSSIPAETDMLLHTKLVAYQDNIGHVVEPRHSYSQTKEEYPYVLHAWAVDSSHSQDCLDDVFPFDEAILEAMFGI